MWVEIFEIDGENYKGYLTNQPYYIKELKVGDIVEFNAENIATVLTELSFDENLKAIISKKALEKRQVNWVLKGEPSKEEDSGWQFYFGDEDQDYFDIVDNCKIITLKEVLSFEPRIEKVLESSHNAFEWNEGKMILWKQIFKYSCQQITNHLLCLRLKVNYFPAPLNPFNVQASFFNMTTTIFCTWRFRYFLEVTPRTL
jgi:hypothetical protein